MFNSPSQSLHPITYDGLNLSAQHIIAPRTVTNFRSGIGRRNQELRACSSPISAERVHATIHTDIMSKRAFKKVILKAHPDRGGSDEHAKQPSGAKEAWGKA